MRTPVLGRTFLAAAVVLTVCLACWETATFVWARSRVRNESREFIVSALPGTPLENHLKYDVQRSHGLLTYQEFNSDLVRDFTHALGVGVEAAQERWVLLVRYGERRYAARTGRAALAEVDGLAGLGAGAAQIPYLSLGVLLGLTLGVFLRLPGLTLVVLISAAAASAFRYLKGCPTCAEPAVFGVALSLIGIGMYTALALVNLIGRPSRGLVIGVSWVAVGAAATQLVLGYGYGDSCVPCAVIALVNWRVGCEGPRRRREPFGRFTFVVSRPASGQCGRGGVSRRFGRGHTRRAVS